MHLLPLTQAIQVLLGKNYSLVERKPFRKYPKWTIPGSFSWPKKEQKLKPHHLRIKIAD